MNMTPAELSIAKAFARVMIERKHDLREVNTIINFVLLDLKGSDADFEIVRQYAKDCADGKVI